MNTYTDSIYTMQVWVNYGITHAQTVLEIGLACAALLALAGTVEFLIKK